MKPRVGSLKINKIDKSLARFTKENKKKKTQIIEIRNKDKDMATYLTEIKGL